MTEPKSHAPRQSSSNSSAMHECEASNWCSHWYLTDRHGKTIPCSADPARHDYFDYLSVEFDTREDTPEPEERPEPEFTCDDVRRDLKKIMKVPRLHGRIKKIAIDIRRLARHHRAIQRETKAIVTTFLGAYNNHNQ